MDKKVVFLPLPRRRRRARLPRTCYADRETIALLWCGRQSGLPLHAVIHQMIAEDEEASREERAYVNALAAQELNRLEDEADADSEEDDLFRHISINQIFQEGLTIFGQRPYSS